MSRWFAAHLDETTLRLLALDPEGADAAAAAHVAGCVRCQARAAAVSRTLDGWRDEARAAADLAFSAADLERQRRTIAARIVRGQRAARVLAFPRYQPTLSTRRADRRWLAAAAAAGLVLGALAGQLPHLRGPLAPAGAGGAESGDASPAVVAVRNDPRPLEDTLLSEVEAALDSEARPALRALDALTPVHYEIR